MAEGFTLEDIAEAMGVAYTTARAFRLKPESVSFRIPAEGWEPALAKLARSRAERLAKLAGRLDG